MFKKRFSENHKQLTPCPSHTQDYCLTGERKLCLNLLWGPQVYKNMHSIMPLDINKVTVDNKPPLLHLRLYSGSGGEQSSLA
jgi:hypothetical protein